MSYQPQNPNGQATKANSAPVVIASDQDALAVTVATVPSHPVTNAGTFAVQESGGALTSLQLIDDGIATAASATPTKGMVAMGTDGTNARALKTDTSGELQVDILTLPALPAGGNNIGDVDILSINGVAPAFGSGARGATVQRVTIATDDSVAVTQGTATNLKTQAESYQGGTAVGAANPLQVSLANHGANATAVKVDGSAVTQPVSIATNTPVGTVAHDAADSGAPVKVGAKAKTALSGVTLVSSDDRTDLFADLDGVQITRPNSAIGDYVNGNASNTDGTSTQVIAAGASGVKHYITDVTITNTSATNIYVELKDGTTVKWTFPVPANGGVTHRFGTPLGGTAATAWNFDPSTAATTVYCSASGFKSKI